MFVSVHMYCVSVKTCGKVRVCVRANINQCCKCGLTAVSEQISISPFISPCFLGVEIPGGDAATPLPFTAFLRENEI